MSLILDAIKKSERERQQQGVPDLSSNHTGYVPQKLQPNKRLWMIAGGIVLLLLVIVFVTKILVSPENSAAADKKLEVPQNKAEGKMPIYKNETPKKAISLQPVERQPHYVPKSQSPQKTLPTMQVISTHSKILQQDAVDYKTNAADEIEDKKVDDEDVEQQAGSREDANALKLDNNADAEETYSRKPQELVEKAKNTEKSTIQKQSKTQNTQPYPSLSELPSDIQSKIPAIEFTSHVYTGDENTSFVFLNQTMLVIGEKMDGKIEVTHITPDGVVLKFNGQAFFLEALQNWHP